MWLCIAFGVLFAVMLLINIFLCSAMTCSCTKSEIIEKEPSVYDDYSIYDSQYGYELMTKMNQIKDYNQCLCRYTNNGKPYGSESDYGSEYGMVEGENGRPEAITNGRPPSEYSKYSQSHHGSTLNRTRN